MPIYYILFAFQVAGFGLIVFLMLQLYLALRQDPAAGRVADASSEVQRNLADMLLELRETSDRINRDLAVRSAALQRQLDDAEQKIAVLQEALRYATPTSSSAAVREPAPRDSYTREPPMREPVAREPARASTKPPEPRRDPSEPSIPAESSTDFQPIDLREAGKYQQILRLADEGLSSLEIARQTQMGREEVELVLGLRNEGKSA